MVQKQINRFSAKGVIECMNTKRSKKMFYHVILTICVISLITSSCVAVQKIVPKTPVASLADFDPSVNQIQVKVTIKAIRALEKMRPIGNPNFFVKITINENEYTSPIWGNSKYVYTPWSAVSTVPKDTEWVFIRIQLFDRYLGINRVCDISPNNPQDSVANGTSAELAYSIKTGHWTGDDWAFYWGFFGHGDDDDDFNGSSNVYFPFNDPLLYDLSGYGRLNGCDDGSIDQHQRDCEMWFDITQTDPDGDGIPYWIETNVYNTSVTVNDSAMDPNHDGIPLFWDWKWGFDPFAFDNHSLLDPENDGLTHYEEYLTSQWGSCPFGKDLFIEMDQMSAGPNGEPASIFPEGAKEMLRSAYDRHNVVYHLDDGSWGEGGGSEMIPFDNLTVTNWGMSNETDELNAIYTNYFLHGNESNWRVGVFHYGVVIYQCSVANGNAFGSDSFQISSNGLENKTKTKILKLYNPLNVRDVVYASAYMHESGHTLGLVSAGVDDQNSKFPYMLDWWKFRPYKSVMNYGYMYKMVDYSDGSRGMNDFNDWDHLDLSYFNREMPWGHH